MGEGGSLVRHGGFENCGIRHEVGRLSGSIEEIRLGYVGGWIWRSRISNMLVMLRPFIS